jgi:hypothetical protein
MHTISLEKEDIRLDFPGIEAQTHKKRKEINQDTEGGRNKNFLFLTSP